MVNSENSHTCSIHVITTNERRGKELEREQTWFYKMVWKEEREEINVLIIISKI